MTDSVYVPELRQTIRAHTQIKGRRFWNVYRNCLHIMCINFKEVTKYVGFSIAFFMGFAAIAQQSAVKPAAGRSTIKKPVVKQDSESFNARIEFDLAAISYAEASPNDNTLQQRAQIGFNLKKEGTFFSETSVMVGTFSEPKSVYYALPEAYVGYGDKEANATFGRKKEFLSFADSFFHFGLMQSHMSTDNINFVEGGMIGLAGHYNSGSFGFMLGYNPIFLPNQGPQTSVEDGRITSTNRWAPSPPAKFKFGEENKDINYAIRDYQLTDIISNSGYMASAYIGSNPERPLVRVSYADKPLNEIVLSRDTYSDITTFEGYVYLSPTVIKHQVTAADVNLDYENFKSTFSVISDTPANVKAKDLEYIQTLSPLSIVSAYASLDLSAWMNKKLEIYGAAAVISGGEIKDINSQGQESTFAVASSRTLFKQPVKMGVKSEMFFIYNRALEADVNFTYDQKLKGSLLSAALKYAPTKNLNLRVGADVLGVENELPADEQGNFLDQNKANDRFFGGVNYAF